MRLFEFEVGSEEFRQQEIKKLAVDVWTNCQPFLKQIKYNPSTEDNVKLYRGQEGGTGVWKGSGYDVLHKVRSDRKPRDTSPKLHRIVNAWMLQKFGWYVRSEGLFTCGSPGVSKNYGSTCVIYPIGRFQYVWSEKIEDMTESLGRTTGYSTEFYDDEKLNQIITDMLENAKWHKNTGLYSCITKKPRTEITIDVMNYYAFPVNKLSNNCIQAQDIDWALADIALGKTQHETV